MPGQIVSLSATGSNNMIVLPAATTSAQGLVIGTLASTTAQTTTVTATVNPGLNQIAVAQTVSVTFTQAAPVAPPVPPTPPAPPTPPPPTAPTIGSFTANRTTIALGQSSTLAWSGITNATTCSINNGVGTVTCGNASTNVTPGSTTTYTFIATGVGGSIAATVSVTVVATTPTIANYMTTAHAQMLTNFGTSKRMFLNQVAAKGFMTGADIIALGDLYVASVRGFVNDSLAFVKTMPIDNAAVAALFSTYAAQDRTYARTDVFSSGLADFAAPPVQSQIDAVYALAIQQLP